jgi:hypothetical protein
MFERKKSAGKIYALPIESIQPSPFQARTNFNEQELAGLAASIRERVPSRSWAASTKRPAPSIFRAAIPALSSSAKRFRKLRLPTPETAEKLRKVR